MCGTSHPGTISTVRTRPTVDYDRGLKHCSSCDKWLPFDQFSPSPHKNGGCGLKSYCKPCGNIRYPHKPRENPKIQPKRHVFDIHSRVELRQCSACLMWLPLDHYFVCGGNLQNICKVDARTDSRERARSLCCRHSAPLAHTPNHSACRGLILSMFLSTLLVFLLEFEERHPLDDLGRRHTPDQLRPRHPQFPSQ